MIKGNTSVHSSVSNQNAFSSNSTSVISSPFSFLIPYNQTQSCDIYGPLCQTGSITVAVSRGAGTTNTALPCSSYLTAQSSYLSGFQDPDEPGAMFARWPVDWQSGFGRSPECKSYAQAYSNGGQYTLSGCPANDAPIPHPPPPPPPPPTSSPKLTPLFPQTTVQIQNRRLRLLQIRQAQTPPPRPRSPLQPRKTSVGVHARQRVRKEQEPPRLDGGGGSEAQVADAVSADAGAG